jgi:hypothetical protein
MWLGLAVSLSAAFAQSESTLVAQSSGVNLNKPAHFQIWRRITLGTYKGVNAYRDALDAAKIKIGDAADEILGRPAFPYARTKTDVELAVLSARADLGVESDQVSLAEVYQRARQAGLELCPAEVGPQLRLEYSNQPLGEALDIAMEPVAGRPESTVFRKLASCSLCRPKDVWRLGDVLRLRRHLPNDRSSQQLASPFAAEEGARQ